MSQRVKKSVKNRGAFMGRIEKIVTRNKKLRALPGVTVKVAVPSAAKLVTPVPRSSITLWVESKLQYLNLNLWRAMHPGIAATI